MQFEEIEALAKANKRPPKRLVDLYAYELLKVCYDRYRKTRDLSEAKEQKRRIFLAWQEENMFLKLKTIEGLHALRIYADGTYAAEIMDDNKNCLYVKKLTSFL